MKKILLAAVTVCLTISPVIAQDTQMGRKVTDYTTGPKILADILLENILIQARMVSTAETVSASA